MNSKQKLAAALRETASKLPASIQPELEKMICHAELGGYSDFESQSPTPCIDLVRDLKRLGLIPLANRAMNGEFDATKEESDAWAAGPDGQAAMNELFRSAPRK